MTPNETWVTPAQLEPPALGTDRALPCVAPGHVPPMHLLILPGQTYRHVCPGCGRCTIMHDSYVTY